MPQDFLNFEIEDFAADEYFIKWVTQNDMEASRFWADFNAKHPQMAHKISQARMLILTLQAGQVDNDDQHQVQRIWENIELKTRAPKGGNVRTLSLIFKVAASVSIICVLSAGLWFGIFKGQYGVNDMLKSVALTNEFIEEVNTTGNVLKIHLSDGSTILLENNSRLKYREDYSKQASRQVYLTGEAFFDIAKNPNQPFFVYANEVVTKVLGTSFRIKAFDNEKNVIVSVSEGNVSVFSAIETKNKLSADNTNKGVVLTPNQQVIYQRNDNSFEKTLVAVPAIVNSVSAKEMFLFDNTPIKNVFVLLEEIYGVEIIFDEEVMQHCFLTVPLGNEPLYEKLKIVCQTIGASYDVTDAKIIISGSGCGTQ